MMASEHMRIRLSAEAQSGTRTFFSAAAMIGLDQTLDPIYTGLVTMVQVLYLLEICCLG